MRVVERPALAAALQGIDLVAAMEEAFVAYSAGRAVVPPVSELVFREAPPGDVHIKAGWLEGEPWYVVKVASGFYDNPRHGLPSSDGLMALFRRATGEPVALLADRGLLTDARTGAAGAVAAKHLATHPVGRIGVLGSGTQARWQLRMLARVTPCREALAWGRDRQRLEAYCEEMTGEGFTVAAADAPAEVAAACDLVVTTTPATRPLLSAADLRPGTHVTAVGADTPGKSELDPWILARARPLVADSVVQCSERGELAGALAVGAVAPGTAVELGSVIAGTAPGRDERTAITVADLTGLGVQDVAVAAAVARALGLGEEGGAAT